MILSSTSTSRDEVSLISFPDLARSDCDQNSPVYCHGKVEQAQLSLDNIFVLASYDCFPGCSGGAVISSTGKFLGIHIGMCFCEDETYKTPIKKDVEYSPAEGAVRTLQWSPHGNGDIDLEAPSEGSSDESFHSSQEASNVDCGVALDALFESVVAVRQAEMFAAANTSHRAHCATFLPAVTIHSLLAAADLGTPRTSRERKYCCTNLAAFDVDKAWAKKMKGILKRAHMSSKG